MIKCLKSRLVAARAIQIGTGIFLAERMAGGERFRRRCSRFSRRAKASQRAPSLPSVKALRKDRVRGLVWVSSYRSLGSPMTPEQLEEWLAPFRTNFVSAVEDLARRNFGHHADPEIVERAVATMSAANPEIIIDVLASKFANEPALLEGLKEVAAPVVAINPDFKPNDHASFDAHGIELIVMSNVGHFTMMEDPATFNEVLEETIKKLAALS